MPPHCDSLDGPVVQAATRALDAGDVDLVLPFVQEAGEPEVRRAFERALAARAEGERAREVADLYFFETVVRVHRAGEGAPFTGLKPAGLDIGPVIPLAERAIEGDDPTPLAEFLARAVRNEVADRFDALRAARLSPGADVAAARRYVDAMLGLEVWAHHLYGAVHASAHEHAGAEHD